MAEKSAIEWTDATFNPWWGCAKVSIGCDHCYAERDAARYQPGRELWGVDAERRAFGDKHWAEPHRWERKAVREGHRLRVFCASMADVFDKNSPDQARPRLWQTIRDTPNLDWLILTKRIGNAARMLPTDWEDGYPNVWLGISVVNQEEADRDIPKLLAIPARIRFLSCEPLLGPIHFPLACQGSVFWGGLHWVIVGGESGQLARFMDPAWADDIRSEVKRAGRAFFMKQGSQFNWPRFKDFESFPSKLQIREFPA